MSEQMRNALQTIAELPIPEQDNMVAANMRAIAVAALSTQPQAPQGGVTSDGSGVWPTSMQKKFPGTFAAVKAEWFRRVASGEVSADDTPIHMGLRPVGASTETPKGQL